MKHYAIEMVIVKHHDPRIDAGIRLLVEKGYSAKEMAVQLKTSPRTIFNYANDLGLTIKGSRRGPKNEKPPQDPDLPPKDPNGSEADPEKTIKENITKKHVKDVSEKLATLTVEHELEMRKIVVALEKHMAIFESVEQMGMSKEEFIDVAIEIGYYNLKEVYLRKVREYEEREAMKQYIEMRAKLNGGN